MCSSDLEFFLVGLDVRLDALHGLLDALHRVRAVDVVDEHERAARLLRERIDLGEVSRIAIEHAATLAERSARLCARPARPSSPAVGMPNRRRVTTRGAPRDSERECS